MKCMPITFFGRVVTSANAVIEIDDVLVARMVSTLHTLSIDLNIFSFTDCSSVAASITTSQTDKLL